MLRALICCVALAIPASGQTTLVKASRTFDPAAGRYLRNQGILIQNGYIQQVGSFEAVRAVTPPDAAMLDLGNLTVLPGLIDCHAHLLLGIPEGMNGADALILTITKMSPMKRVLAGAERAKEDLESGFTIVRNVGMSGIDGDVALRDGISEQWVAGPRIRASARKIVPRGGQAIPVQQSVLAPILNEDFLEAANPDEGRRAVLDNLRVNADVIKVVADEGARTIDASTMKAIVAEAHKVGVRVAAHATSTLGIQSSIDAGVDSIEHADSATQDQFRAMRAGGIVLVPTLWPRELAASWPNLVAVDAPMRLRQMDRERYLTEYMADQREKMDRARQAGVKIAFGSDECFDRRALTRGQATLELLAAQGQFGMSPAEALRAATIDAADLLEVKAVAGSIEAKKFADLVGVDGDPLQNLSDVTKVKFVMKGGRVVRDDAHR